MSVFKASVPSHFQTEVVIISESYIKCICHSCNDILLKPWNSIIRPSASPNVYSSSIKKIIKNVENNVKPTKNSVSETTLQKIYRYFAHEIQCTYSLTAENEKPVN
jgi:hypothetical protein